ncbi:Phosphopantetheine attachment site, partial [Izhakiella capsodis]
WCELLGLTQVGRHDNFFELGGHSLMAVQLINRIQSDFLVNVPISAFFRSPTIFELSEFILSAQTEMSEDTEIDEIKKLIDSMSPEELALFLKEGSN